MRGDLSGRADPPKPVKQQGFLALFNLRRRRL
jgi:hypothetical protein